MDRWWKIIYTFVEDLLAMDAPFKYEEELHLELFSAIYSRDKTGASSYIEDYMKVLREDVVEMMEG